MLKDSQGHERVAHAPEHVFVVGRNNSPMTCTQVRDIWGIRRSRRNHFPASLFSDPAWDILLHLYATALAGQRSSVTQTVIASNVPEATALRWLGHLLDLGLCRKKPDPTDRRRLFVSLTAAGMDAMDSYFAGVRASGCDQSTSRAA